MNPIALSFTKAGMDVVDLRISDRSLVLWFVHGSGTLCSLRVSVGLAFLSAFGPTARYTPGWRDTGTAPTRVAHTDRTPDLGRVTGRALVSLVGRLYPALRPPSRTNPTYATYPGIVELELAAARAAGVGELDSVLGESVPADAEAGVPAS